MPQLTLVGLVQPPAEPPKRYHSHAHDFSVDTHASSQWVLPASGHRFAEVAVHPVDCSVHMFPGYGHHWAPRNSIASFAESTVTPLATLIGLTSDIDAENAAVIPKKATSTIIIRFI